MSTSSMNMRRALADTMKELMSEKSFASISVKSICESCGINRKSFYYHYRDKFDLVNDIYNMEFFDAASAKKYHSVWDFIDDVCVYIDKNRRFYRSAFSVEGQNSFRECFCESLEPMLISFCEQQSTSGKEAKRMANYLAVMISSAFVHWLEERNPMGAADFSNMLRTFFSGVSERLLRVTDYTGTENRASIYSYN